MERHEFDSLPLDRRMQIMKFYEVAKRRWKRNYDRELALNQYLSWIILPEINECRMCGVPIKEGRFCRNCISNETNCNEVF